MIGKIFSKKDNENSTPQENEAASQNSVLISLKKNLDQYKDDVFNAVLQTVKENKETDFCVNKNQIEEFLKTNDFSVNEIARNVLNSLNNILYSFDKLQNKGSLKINLNNSNKIDITKKINVTIKECTEYSIDYISENEYKLKTMNKTPPKTNILGLEAKSIDVKLKDKSLDFVKVNGIKIL